MKLLFVGFLHGFGGAEKQLIMLANAMAERENVVRMVSLAGNNPCYTVSDKVMYSCDGFCSNSKVINAIHRFLYLKQEITEFKPDIVIHFYLQSAYLSVMMGSRISQISIYAERCDPLDKEYRGIRGILRNLVVKRIGGFVFQTKGARECFNVVCDKRCAIIPNPVFIKDDEIIKSTERRKVIVNVGRLHEQKDQELLVQAFASLKDKYQDYCVEIFGEGELKSSLELLITALGLEDRVFLRGTTNAVLSRIHDASLFVLTSVYEGMPNALLEAMSLGVPCISTNFSPGGAKELIENGVNGLLVPCDDVSALVKAMDYMLSHTKQAEIMGKAAKEIRMRMNPDTIYDRWEYEISRIIRGTANDE